MNPNSLLVLLSYRFGCHEEHQTQGSGNHHVNSCIDSREPRVLHKQEYAVGTFAALCLVIACLVYLPSVHFHGLVHQNGSPEVAVVPGVYRYF